MGNIEWHFFSYGIFEIFDIGQERIVFECFYLMKYFTLNRRISFQI